MKIIKQLTCLIACFVVLSSSFMVGYAVDDDVIFTADDLIDFGYVLDDNGCYVYYGKDDPLDFGFNFFSSSYKHYEFDPITDLPWSTFPQYIKDIVYMDCDDLKNPEGSFIVPFVCPVVVSDTTVQLFVGVNVGWGWLNDGNYTLSIWSLPKNTYISSSSVLYRFSWNFASNYVVSDWTEYDTQVYGNAGNLLRRINYYWNSGNAPIDIYGYGGNGVSRAYTYDADGQIRSRFSCSVSYRTENPDIHCIFYVDGRGFSSGNFVNAQDTAFSNVHFKSFKPPSEAELLQKEQNGLISDFRDSIEDIFYSSGESELTTLPDAGIDDYNKAESDLVSGYNPDNIEDDLDIELDPSALQFIWDLFDEFVTADNAVFTLFISIMAVGIIALILGR